MKQFLIVMFASCFVVFGCTRIKNKTKETLNKGGETVGKTATEFFDGVGEGIEKTLALNVQVSAALQQKGLKTGKYYVKSTPQRNNNILVMYIIFDNNFKDTLFIKAFDKEGLETGRLKQEIAGVKDDAGYFDFEFDERTIIEGKSKITIE